MVFNLSTIDRAVKFFIDVNQSTMLLLIKRRYKIVKPPEKSYINTTVNTDLLRSLKVLAAQKDTRLNRLLEEAIQDLLKKHEKKTEK